MGQFGVYFQRPGEFCAMSRVSGPQGTQPYAVSPRTPGPLGHKDAADPDRPGSLKGDTPGSLGINDHADPMSRRSQQPRTGEVVLEFLHRTDKTVSQIDRRLSQADLGRRAVQAVTGARAFRKYNWLTNAAAKNTATVPNFRGMVVS